MPQATLQAGVVQIDITPPMGVEMSGYGPYEKRIATEVLDPLYAHALWLEAGEERLLILTLDLISIGRVLRDAVAHQISRQCGLPPENILIAASHTHSGPATQLMIGWGERDQAYLRRLEGLLVEAAVAAQGSLTPARLGACRQRIQGIGVNREQPALGPLDTAAQLMRIDTADGTPLAVVYNIGAHGVARYPYTRRISADWPGLVAAGIQDALPPAVALFLQGCLGNINAHAMSFARRDVIVRQQVADMRTGDVAMRICEQILPALTGLQTQAEVELGAAWRVVSLPCGRPDRAALERTIEENLATAVRLSLADLRPLHERIGDETELEVAWRQARFAVDAARHQLTLLEAGECEVQAPVQILRIGEAALVAWPGEIYVELGLELRQRSPFPLTFVAGLANDTVGYIPTPAAYESRGKPNEFGVYPTSFTPLIYGALPFRSDVGTILVEESLRLLNQMRG